MTEADQNVRAAWRLHDDLLKAFRQAQARVGEPVVFTCTKGCSACCSEAAQTTKQEAQAVFNAIPEAKRAQVKARVAQWLEKWRSCGLQAHQRDETLNVHEYRAAKLVCPLLEAGLCSVYDSRPLCCRAHNAAKPREFCDDDGKRKDQVFFDTRAITADAVHRMAWRPGRLEGQRPVYIIEFALLGDWLAFFYGLIPESEVIKADGAEKQTQ